MSPEGGEALPLALIGLLIAGLLAFILTPVSIRFASRVGAIDQPGDRRVHAHPTPRGGGLAIAASFVAVGVGILAWNRAAGAVDVAKMPRTSELVALFAGAVLAAVLGFLDDRFDLRARWQFLGQFGLAGIAVASGLTVGFIANPFGAGRIDFTNVFAVVFTVFWIVGMINSINWIDGLDGLSSGVAAIAALTLGGISLQSTQDEPVVALVCFVLAGALAGFLPWNFHPARIFVGTSGVFLIGYTLAVLSALGTAKVAVALLVLGVPIIDTFWIIVRRLARGSSPFAPDRGHLHHRLLDLGLGQREAVLLIYAISVVLAILGFVLSGRSQLYAFMGIVVASGVLLYLMTVRTRETGGSGLDASAYDEPPPSDPARVAGTAAGQPDEPGRVAGLQAAAASERAAPVPVPEDQAGAAAPAHARWRPVEGGHR